MKLKWENRKRLKTNTEKIENKNENDKTVKLVDKSASLQYGVRALHLWLTVDGV